VGDGHDATRFDLNEDVCSDWHPERCRVDHSRDTNDSVADESIQAITDRSFGGSAESLGDFSAGHPAVFDQQVNDGTINAINVNCHPTVTKGRFRKLILRVASEKVKKLSGPRQGLSFFATGRLEVAMLTLQCAAVRVSTARDGE
jgi:hypothetical protein